MINCNFFFLRICQCVAVVVLFILFVFFLCKFIKANRQTMHNYCRSSNALSGLSPINSMQCNAMQYLHLKHFFKMYSNTMQCSTTHLYLTICVRGHYCHRNLFDYGRRTKTNCNNFCCCSRFSVVEYLRIHSMDDMSELSREIVNCIAKMTTFYER